LFINELEKGHFSYYHTLLATKYILNIFSVFQLQLDGCKYINENWYTTWYAGVKMRDSTD